MESLVNNTSFWKDRRVLVTGHTGFKGSWLVLWLMTLGADVWGYSLEPLGQKSLYASLGLDCVNHPRITGRLHHCSGDIRVFDGLQEFVREANPDIVFHLAAQPLVRESYRDPLGTWSTNVNGSLNILESLKFLDHFCSIVMVTTDKVYLNKEWDYGYRETDELGGHDPYSASKSGAEIAINSWRSSFCGNALHQTSKLLISTARSGNVIGGGDWSTDRIIPDIIKSLSEKKQIVLRRPLSTRPWQHVLEPLAGYLRLAELLYRSQDCEGSLAGAFNFGPSVESNRSVQDIVETSLRHWPGSWEVNPDSSEFHESGRLHLQIDKAYHQLRWKPVWDFDSTVERTIIWYKSYLGSSTALDCCLYDIASYMELSNASYDSAHINRRRL